MCRMPAARSELFAPASFQIRPGLVRKLVKLAGLGVALNLLVEQTLIELVEPLAQLGDIFGGELLDRRLNLLELGHGGHSSRHPTPARRSYQGHCGCQ